MKEVLIGLVIGGISAALLTLALTTMFPAAHASTPQSTNPKDGNMVSLVNGVVKWCDGPNLIYQAGAGSNGVSLQLSKDDPQCQ